MVGSFPFHGQQTSGPSTRDAAANANLLLARCKTIANAVVIPAAALLPAQEGAGVAAMVVDASQVAHARIIELGARDGGKVEIVKGLKEGESVVIEGGLGLEDGKKVRIRKPGEKDEDDKKDDDKKPSPAGGKEADKK